MLRRLLILPVLVSSAAHAQVMLGITSVNLDRPTVNALGVQVLITGDTNRNARITVRYRPAGGAFKDGPALLRVRPETLSVTVPEQFAGSVFDLQPDTDYELELRAVDADGPLDTTRTVMGRTRAVPRSMPATPRLVAVSTAAALRTALTAAQAGDVITIAAGTYTGSFAVNASGTAMNPIVIRGADAAAVIFDGNACAGCNVFEVYGSYTHLESFTLRNAVRAVRFQGAGTTGNVARRLIIRDVVHGIAGTTGQTDFYICDNDVVGRLVWPWALQAGSSANWDDRGVDMTGDGHVVCHNKLQGFGDPVVNKKSRARSWDSYGNDIYDSFDGTELDEGEGNVRVYRNRWTNVMAPISIQPMNGGPGYALRNVLFNIPDEQIKLKSLGGTQFPSGVVALHNTFVSPFRALNLQAPTSVTQFNFVIGNNLFIGPQTLTGSRTVDWTCSVDGGVFDYNGYYPNGGFFFGQANGSNRVYANWAAVQAGGQVEQNGTLLTRPIFATDFVGPTDAGARHSAPDFTLAAGSNARDRGQVHPGINTGFQGSAPDLGALELGCPVPVYGPRPAGTENVPTYIDCVIPDAGTGAGGGAGGGSGGGSAGGATGGGAGGGSGTAGGTATGGGSGGATDGGSGGGTEAPRGCGCDGSGGMMLVAAAAMLRRKSRPLP